MGCKRMGCKCMGCKCMGCKCMGASVCVQVYVGAESMKESMNSLGDPSKIDQQCLKKKVIGSAGGAESMNESMNFIRDS